MMMSGKDFLKSHVLSRWRKVYSDWEDVRSSGRACQAINWETVDRLTDGTYLYAKITTFFTSLI